MFGKGRSLRVALFSLVLITKCALAQYSYSVVKTTTLSGAAEVITVQQPSSGSTTVRAVGAYIDSTVAIDITIERNGSAASATSLTIANVNPGDATPRATAWSGSNVGVGTIISKATIPAGGSQLFDLTRIIMAGNGINKNFTLRTSSITGTVNIIIVYTESTL